MVSVMLSNCAKGNNCSGMKQGHLGICLSLSIEGFPGTNSQQCWLLVRSWVLDVQIHVKMALQEGNSLRKEQPNHLFQCISVSRAMQWNFKSIKWMDEHVQIIKEGKVGVNKQNSKEGIEKNKDTCHGLRHGTKLQQSQHWQAASPGHAVGARCHVLVACNAWHAYITLLLYFVILHFKMVYTHHVVFCNITMLYSSPATMECSRPGRRVPTRAQRALHAGSLPILVNHWQSGTGLWVLQQVIAKHCSKLLQLRTGSTWWSLANSLQLSGLKPKCNRWASWPTPCRLGLRQQLHWARPWPTLNLQCPVRAGPAKPSDEWLLWLVILILALLSF